MLSVNSFRLFPPCPLSFGRYSLLCLSSSKNKLVGNRSGELLDHFYSYREDTSLIVLLILWRGWLPVDLLTDTDIDWLQWLVTTLICLFWHRYSRYDIVIKKKSFMRWIYFVSIYCELKRSLFCYFFLDYIHSYSIHSILHVLVIYFTLSKNKNITSRDQYMIIF